MGALLASDDASVRARLIAALRVVVPRIKGRDRALADQLTRAARSVALNIAESNYSDPGNRRARLFTAAGSANETRAALRVAVEWGYCAAVQAEELKRWSSASSLCCGSSLVDFALKRWASASSVDRMRKGMWAIIAVAGAVGCGAASPDELRTRAAYEMKCPADQLELTDLGDDTTGVDGCGQRQVYVQACKGQGGLRECQWVLNSQSK